MDSVILLQRAGVNTGLTSVIPEIDTGGRLPGGFSSDFLRVVSFHYPVLADLITAEQLDYAVAQMVNAQRLFFDPSGWKSTLLLGQIAPFSQPRRLPDWDVLNEARQPWIDPTDRTVVHRESALDLWDRALEDAYSTTAAGIAWLNADSEEEADTSMKAFKKLLQDISYETGLPCDQGRITYADSVVPV